jgi:hypothetical protein
VIAIQPDRPCLKSPWSVSQFKILTLITSAEWISGTPIHTLIDMRRRKAPSDNLLIDNQLRRLFMDESQVQAVDQLASGNGFSLDLFQRSTPARRR